LLRFRRKLNFSRGLHSFPEVTS